LEVDKMFYRLNAKQLNAIKLLTIGNDSLEEIAKKCGVTRMTLWKWRQQPSFKKALEIALDVKNNV
jgi:transposase-like protein